MLVRIDASEVRIVTRNRHDGTVPLQDLTSILERLLADPR